MINLGTGRGVTVRELVTAFEKVYGQVINKVDKPPRAGDVAGAYANADTARRLLGWEARLSIEQGIADALKWGEVREKCAANFLDLIGIYIDHNASAQRLHCDQNDIIEPVARPGHRNAIDGHKMPDQSEIVYYIFCKMWALPHILQKNGYTIQNEVL